MKNRLLKTFTSLVLTVLMVLSIMPAFAITIGAEGETYTWTRVTDVETLKAGGTFIIGYEATASSGVIIPMANTGDASTTKAGVMYSGANASSGDRTTLDMKTYKGAGDKFIVTIAESEVNEGKITIKTADGYIGNANTKNNCKLFEKDSTTNGTSFTATIGDNDVITLKNGNGTYHTFQYNTSYPRFACYGGTQKNLVIYQRTSSPEGGSEGSGSGTDTPVTPVECPHNNTEERGRIEPTCTEKGIEAGTYCNDCKKYISGGAEISALGHDEVKHDAQTATCTAVGWDAYVTCTRCDYSTYVEIPMIAHIYENDECTVCGQKKPKYTKVDLAYIEATDTIIIVATTEDGKNYAMGNDNGTGAAPGAVKVEINNGSITTDAANILWNIAKDENGNLTIYPDGKTNIWLYSTNSNNGIRVGDSDTKTFVMDADSGYLKNTSTTSDRYLGVYNEADWRCYTATTGNIANQTFTFYKLIDANCTHSNTKNVAEVSATCTESGTAAGVYCNDCKTYIRGHEEIKAKGHTWGEIIDGCCECSVCHDKTKTISEVLESADGTAVVVCGTVTLIKTPWNDSNNSISVTIADADGKELLLYKMATKVEVGDIIRVSGTKTTYNGTKEINTGATAEIIGHKDVEVVYTEMTIPEVIAADDNTPVTVKGTVKEINTPWNDYNKNISVTIVDADGNELYMYRLATKVDLGDEITVKGLVGSYNSNKQIAAGATAEITGKATVLNSVALSLNKGVTVKVKINIPESWLTANAGAKVVFSNVVSLDAKAGENVYSVDLTPAQINDALTVKITSKDGSTIFLDEKDVSVSAYRAKAVAAGASTQLIALLDAALTYSNAADCAIEEELTETFTDVADPQIEHENVNAKLLTAFSGNLGTYASIYINVNTANVKEGDKLVLKIGETGIINDDIAKYITKDGQIVISGLYPANFDDTISIDTTIEGSNATFTFNSYLKAIYKDNSSTKQVKNLAVATYLYGLAAEAYLATLQ